MNIEKGYRGTEETVLPKSRYQGKVVDEAVEIVCIAKKLGYVCQDRWNRTSFNGLIPIFADDKPPMLCEDEKIAYLRPGEEGCR